MMLCRNPAHSRASFLALLHLVFRLLRSGSVTVGTSDLSAETQSSHPPPHTAVVHLTKPDKTNCKVGCDHVNQNKPSGGEVAQLFAIIPTGGEAVSLTRGLCCGLTCRCGCLSENTGAYLCFLIFPNLYRSVPP